VSAAAARSGLATALDAGQHQPETRGSAAMAFEAIKAEIRALLEQSIDEPEDAHELHLQLLEKLNELKATGMPLPDDLVELERQLAARHDTLPEA
jgi:hypothetical protein